MELHEVKVIIKHGYDFFVDNRIESFIAKISLKKIETHISEINKLAVVKIEYDSCSFLLVINPQNIQLHFQSLEHVEQGIRLFELLEEKVQGQLRLDFVVFNGILRTQRNEEHYNQAFSKSVPDKVKVKMLGLDIQSSHFDYRVSLNKHNDVTKVHAKVLMQCGLKEILQNASVALKELEEELQQLNEIF